jgi:hypothetical protein
MTGRKSCRRPLALAVAGGALLAVLAGCSGNPFGGSSISDTDRVFLLAAGNWDRNHDSIVTCDEWKAYASELFDQADANRDGSVDETEFKTIISTDRMFETVNLGYYDANGDGRVSREEFVEKPNRAFVLLDHNKQCQLTSDVVAGARSLTTVPDLPAAKTSVTTPGAATGGGPPPQ